MLGVVNRAYCCFPADFTGSMKRIAEPFDASEHGPGMINSSCCTGVERIYLPRHSPNGLPVGPWLNRTTRQKVNLRGDGILTQMLCAWSEDLVPLQGLQNAYVIDVLIDVRGDDPALVIVS